MSIRQHLTNEQARQFGDEFGCDWDRGCPSVEQLIRESDIDLERVFSGRLPAAEGERQTTPFSGRNTLARHTKFAD